MDISFTSDNNYLPYLGVTMCSVCENTPGPWTFHVILSGDVTAGGKDYVKGIADRYGAGLHFYPIDNALLGVLPAGRSGQPMHISVAAYYRLFLASILPASVDKVMYLDCDLIAVSSLREIWDTDMTECPIAAVPDMTEGELWHYRRLRYSPSKGYFNSGVLLINLKYWREKQCQKAFEAFIAEHLDRIVYHDQDVLNFVFCDNKKVLPVRFNVQEACLYDNLPISWEYDEQLDEALRHPVIIHYTTGQKPWNIDCKHPWKARWYEYLAKTGLRDFKPVKKKVKMSAYARARSLCVKLGLLQPLRRYRKEVL